MKGTAYVIIAPDGKPIITTLYYNRRRCIVRFIGPELRYISVSVSSIPQWKELRKRGFKCRKCHVTIDVL
jgi:hypothetical protein